MTQARPSPKFRDRLAAIANRVLTHRRVPIVVAAVSVCLTLPSLTVGWKVDDYFHRLIILGSRRNADFPGSPWAMFRFLDGDPARTMEIVDFGALPWWTVPDIRGSFWRPATVLTHWLDYALWPDWPAMMHAHNLVWLGLTVLAACMLYRRMMGPTLVAGLAALLFAMDDAHSMPAGWIANRNILPAGFFGILAIMAHDRWRRRSEAPWAFAAFLCMAVSLLCAEAGVGTLAYLAAHAVTFDRGRWTKKVISLAPYLAILVIWRTLWSVQGHGVANLGLYIDPLNEPVRFLANAVGRMPLLILGQWAMPPAETAILLDAGPTLILQLYGWAVFVMLAVAFRPLLRQDPVARFWATGMCLSLIPICATFPADRLLLFVGIGAMGLLAQLLGRVFRLSDSPLPDLRASRPLRIMSWTLAVIHLVLAPLLLSLRSANPMGSRKLSEQLEVRTPLDESVEEQDVIIVNAPSILHALYLPVVRELSGEPVPRHTRVLAPSLASVSIRRPDDRALIVRPGNSFIAWKFDRLFRSEQCPMFVGQRVELTGLTIEVTAVTPDGRPAEAAFRFHLPLESPSLRWLQWKDGEFVPFTPPSIGEIIRLPRGMPSIW